jgi:hypothetical protein
LATFQGTPLRPSNPKFLELWVRSSWELNFKFLTETRRGVSHCGLAIYIKKYLKAKEELWNSNISASKNITFKKLL